ncbi:hypothetical protein J6590_072843 [Homalodisca vitripennis]|nr:hypothetical protein J6590_072843 [Homalodisca vitripennis]
MRTDRREYLPAHSMVGYFEIAEFKNFLVMPSEPCRVCLFQRVLRKRLLLSVDYFTKDLIPCI